MLGRARAPLSTKVPLREIEALRRGERLAGLNHVPDGEDVAVDLDGLSLLRRSLESAAPGREPPMPAGALLALQIALAFLVAPLINAIAAFGEEWGWRGWLLPGRPPQSP